MNDVGAFPGAGSMVHFIDDEAAHLPAIVLRVQGEHARRLWLRVLKPGHTDYERHWVTQGDERGTWHWPEGTTAMSEPDLNFAQFIRHGRRSHGLTQRAAADAFGVDFTYISKLENDACPFPPSDDLIRKMADRYEIPSDMLFVAAGKCPPDLLTRMKTSLTFVNRVRELAPAASDGATGAEGDR